MSILDLTKRRVRKAKRDLRSARTLYKDRDWENVCYLSQQAAEKALKSYLIQQNVVPPKIHSLPVLCKKCMKFNAAFSQFLEYASVLTKYATEMRYPDEVWNITKEEAKRACQNAKMIYRFCKQKIKGENK